ncbi:MAG: hypothetical protein COT74_10915 [Bdellovibrionales bacterium CG10_big_fil_rev_8_21_14_0_10_45_34]|nr:MAG: hypothetical protein COT74_10915 [Bdellovibrionales bacterium CG10_big_fil_rev_8_21_14_0_10_45_34]
MGTKLYKNGYPVLGYWGKQLGWHRRPDLPNSKQPSIETIVQTPRLEVQRLGFAPSSRYEVLGPAFAYLDLFVTEGRLRASIDFGFKTEVCELELGSQMRLYPNSHLCIEPISNTAQMFVARVAEFETRTELNPSRFYQDLNTDWSLISSPATMNLSALSDLASSVIANSIDSLSPKFMNQLYSGVIPHAIIADNIRSQTKTTLAIQEASPVFSQIEVALTEAICQLIGWSCGTSDGISVPGGTFGNFMALHCARIRKWPEGKSKGFFGKPARIYVSSEAHYSFKKGALALGFGIDNIVEIATDEHGKMIVSQLAATIANDKRSGFVPLLVGATAGTTVQGAFDPLEEIARLCQSEGIWFHVDAAWGCPALFSKKLKHLVVGIEAADSVTFDAHKFFASSLTATLFLTKHKSLLLEANDVAGGDYLFHNNTPESDRGRLTWQCGRGPDLLAFWLLWKHLGLQGLSEVVDHFLVIQQECVKWIQTQQRLKLMHQPEYLNLCVEVLHPQMKTDNEWSAKVRRVLKAKNQAFVNYSTNSEGVTFLRLILVHPHISVQNILDILNDALSVTVDDVNKNSLAAT